MFWHKKEGDVEEKQSFFSKLFHKEENFSFEQGKAPILEAKKNEPSIHPEVVASAFKKVGVDVKKDVSPIQKREELQVEKEQLSRETSNFESIKKGTDFELRERKRHLQEAEFLTNKKTKTVMNKEKELLKKEDQLKEKQQKLLTKENFINKKAHELEDFNITIDAKSKHVDSRRKDVERKEARLAKEKNSFLKDIDLFEKKREEIGILKEDLKGEKTRYENKLGFMNKAFQHRLEKKEKNLKDRWVDIHKKEAAIDIAKEKFNNQKEEFEEKGFELFLEEEKRGEHNITAEKLEEMHENLKIPELEQANLYKKITNCREFVKNNNIEEAKKLYNEIRNEFYNLEANEADKEVIKNTIRDIYDTINLAALGR